MSTLLLALLLAAPAGAKARKPQAAAAKAAEAAKPAPPPPETAELPPGTLLSVELVDGVSSAKSKAGDVVRARVLEGVYSKGRVAVPPGATVRLVVTEAVPSGRLSGVARLGLAAGWLDVEGSTFAVATDTLSYLGDPHAGKNVGSLIGGALQGAIMGVLFGGKEGAVLGAGAGAGAGAIGNILKGKQDVSFEQGARLLFETKAPLAVPVYAAPAAPPAPPPAVSSTTVSTPTAKPSS